ncbi:unnamed protein product [Paramecium octaurelia]|uniref:Uncharacterized protein n=1 Tax=Paramecium octaurelia TaxID=43137 RepID=A0A8S1Y0Z3_PAROT|nr:unnamed protein product [Paramecium octaurelia]
MIKHRFHTTKSSFTFAFNKDCSFVSAACRDSINIYEFSQGMLKYIQLLKSALGECEHSTFHEKSNQLLSGIQMEIF